ncbi:hypothetical protein PDIDSM_3146 [Penicillium digitatum]|nr:hypothetical protein PDIDSM_3146 [Penicillium digitatum]
MGDNVRCCEEAKPTRCSLHSLLGARTRLSDRVVRSDVSSRRPMKRRLSDELISESMGTQGWCSANSLSSSARPKSTGVLADDRTVETLGGHGIRALRSPSCTSVGHVRKYRRWGGEPRRVSGSASQHVRSGVPQCINERPTDPKIEISAPSKEVESHRAQGFATRADTISYSAPIAMPSQDSVGTQNASLATPMQAQVQEQEPLNTSNDPKKIHSGDRVRGEAVTQEAKPHEMFRQPETHTITEEQLISEVRGIYTGLVMVEKKCIEIDRQQAQSKVELSQAQWQTYVSLHRTLLYEHHDFFLASQHPSAGPILRDLATKYAMPARMWRYGVHSFLELLRQKLPGSMEYMLDFVYLSYSMITLLLESVPKFRATWLECLGDLARYRMAVEEFDRTDRELWAGHHLAFLARPDVLRQFFHYTKALISVRAFPNALKSMIQLVTPLMKINMPVQGVCFVTSFVTAHGALFMQAPVEEFVSRANVFLTTLRKEIGRVDWDRQQDVQLMSCNIAAIFQYGNKNAVVERDFTLKSRNPSATDRLAAMRWASSASNVPIHTTSSDLSSQLAFRASSLTFHTLIVMLGQIDDPKIYPSLHISMAFVWCLALNPAAVKRLEPLVPWSLLANYLNTLFRPDTIISKIEAESFPLLEDSTTHQLPEDFLIRGQAWSRLYYPDNFFDGAPTEDNRPLKEEPSTVIPRSHRCLWLGVRIATFTRWITYDQTRRFTPTRLADEFAPVAESPAYLTGDLYSLGTERPPSFKREMQEV